MQRLLSRRSVAVFAGMAILLLALPAAVSADSPHFVSASAQVSGVNLVVSFKEAGLGSFNSVDIGASATATTTYECVNNGSNHPKASNKTSFTSQTSVPPEPFAVTKSGAVSGSLTLSPPSAESLGFSCPSGQTETFVGVVYTNVKVFDTTTGAFADIPGKYSAP